MYSVTPGGVRGLNKDNGVTPGIKPDLKKERGIEYDSPAGRVSGVNLFAAGLFHQWVNKGFELQPRGNISKDNTTDGCSVECAILLKDRTAPPGFNFTANGFCLQDLMGNYIGIHHSTSQLAET
jgi:hypothetical protein|tara:strand:- start:82 stop:453 length:372 start_codon:yes stop_codon:yes gene_type:complete